MDKKINDILKTEYSNEFDAKRKNSMVNSYYKYGKAALNYPINVDAIASLKKRIELYEQTGNMDYLVDIANFAMLEYMFPRKVNAFYRAGTSEKDSPGVVGLTVKELETMEMEV